MNPQSQLKHLITLIGCSFLIFNVEAQTYVPDTGGTFSGDINVIGYIRTIDGSDRLRFFTNSSESYSRIEWGDDSNDRLSFFYNHHNGSSSDKEVMTLLSNGNVGIGTTSPDGLLDIEGTGDSHMVFGTDNDHAHHIVSYRDLVLNSYDGFFFRNNSIPGDVGSFTTLMRLTETGDLGIGTNNPSAKLEVNGNIISEEIKVQDVTGADFVFEDDYPLLSLEEIKEYVTQNKHLPDVAPAKEMEENGINLGEMNMLLLRKIEELTLYQIELLDRISKLEKEKNLMHDLNLRIQKLEQQK